MFKDISFGKAICGMAICLLFAGYAECNAANYKLIDSKQFSALKFSDKPVKKSNKVDVATIPESNVIIVEDK